MTKAPETITVDELVKWLNAEAHVMPPRARKAFAAFLRATNPPQKAFKFGRVK